MMVKESIISKEDIEEINRITPEEIEKSNYNPFEEFDLKHDGSFNPFLLRGNKIIPDNRPWGNHKELITEDMDFYQVVEIIRNIAKRDLRYGAISAILYLSGARVGEILKGKFADGTDYLGIKWSDLDYNDESKILSIKTPVEKREENRLNYQFNRKYQYIFRTSRVFVDDNYKLILDVLAQYSDKYGINILSRESPMFEVTEEAYRKWMVRNYKANLHIFRHLRATHLIRYHNLTEPELRKYFAWSNTSQMPSLYAHASQSIIVEKLKGFSDPMKS